MASQSYGSMPCVSMNVDRGQLCKIYTIQEELLKWRTPSFFKYLEESCNARKEGALKVFDLFDEHHETFEWILHIIGNDDLPSEIPQLRASRLNSMVDIYAAAHRLRLDKVMNVVLDAFLVDINSNPSFPVTLIREIYQKTFQGCGLRRWFVEQVTMSVESEDFENFSEYWPHEALADLAVHCMGRFVPPLRLRDMTKFYPGEFL